MFTYEQGALLVCPMCGHEWAALSGEAAPETSPEFGDSVGDVLADGVGDPDIEATVPALVRMQLKSSVVKKVL